MLQGEELWSRPGRNPLEKSELEARSDDGLVSAGYVEKR